MAFTRHRLQAIREGNLRARCSMCGQSWTSYDVRSVCPGVFNVGNKPMKNGRDKNSGYLLFQMWKAASR